MNLQANEVFVLLATGIGATAMLDLWSLLRERWLGIAPPNYAHVGRWMAGWLRGRFVLDSIAATEPVRGEMWIGWVVHYGIGLAYAVLLVLLFGTSWLQQPTPGPALLVGVVTVVAPFFIMQPGMGAGIAASRTPNPPMARLHSLLSHAIFGFGMYCSAWIAQALFSNG
ncbi:MAG TPA: DUF2938 domain-containing protein [Xanthomonadales bacterium]|nr:DUF2938 domain-containing protein [Xanthomonadales bacterium]